MKETKERCVLTLPMYTEPWQEHILEKRFRIIEHLKNSLIRFELRKLGQLKRTAPYRELMAKLDTATEKEKKVLFRERSKLLRDAGFSEYAFLDDITPMQKHFVEHIYSQVAYKAASDVWRAFEKHLFGTGTQVSYHKRGTLESVANKKHGNGMKYEDSVFIWTGGKCEHQIKLKIAVAEPSTEYEKEMLTKPIKYLRVVRKWMKNRYKYYLQFALDGSAVQKPRAVGSGRVGIDIGTQTVAIVSAETVQLLELADQVNQNHKKKCALQRKLDASKRATNSENYNPDGTIKRPTKGKRMQWHYSGHYRKMAAKVRELERKNAAIRKYQHNCLANAILAMGDEVYVETMSYKGLQRRAKETTVDEKGRYKKKKRFGKSLANKAPAMFLSILDVKLKSIAGTELHKVNTYEYRASQYDHTSQAYRKKELYERQMILSNGDTVQRDLYSAFLLMNSDPSLECTDQSLCEQTYEAFKSLHDEEIQRIRKSPKQYPSSFGIA